MLDETHSLEENILLTHNYNTSRAAHQRLEIIMKRECEKVMKIDFRLQILTDTVLHIANVEEFQWLLQAELKAIKDGRVLLKISDASRNCIDNSLRAFGLADGLARNFASLTRSLLDPLTSRRVNIPAALAIPVRLSILYSGL
jgi:hypothetical protein